MQRQQQQQQQQQLSYEEPYWAPSKSKPKYPYHLEIMKDFQLMDEVIPLHQHSFYLIGRSVNTSNSNTSYGTIQLEHGSISRHHAIIQHASNGRVYLYDLSSTHGTYWNTKKNHKLKPLRYVPLRLGDKIIFGESTRTYILSVAKECEESVLNLEESLRDQSTQLQQQQKSTKSKKRKRNQDHTDDNDREEENEENEEAFEYDEDDERRYKRLRIEEQITPESLFDDNDEFFDRTMKRTKTSALTTTTVNPIETLHSLTEKQQSVYSELYLLKKQYSQLEQEYNHDQMFNKIKSTTTTDGGGHGEDDELDAYMNSITKGLRSETEQQLKSLKIQIEKWEKEHAELTELIKIAKPANQSVQSKDEKIAEIERDRLTKDMFYQTDRKKRLPITTQTSTTPLTPDKTKNDTTTSEKPLIEKKKPIIYGSAPSITTTTTTSTSTTTTSNDGDGDNRNNREVRLVPTVTPKPNQNQQ